MKKYNVSENENQPINDEKHDSRYDYHDEDDYYEKAPKVRKFREYRAR